VNGDPAPPLPGPSGADIFKNAMGVTKVSIALVDVVGAAQSGAFISKQLKSAGVTVTAVVPMPAESPDLSAQVAALAQGGAQAVDLVLDNATTLRVLAEAAKSGLASKLKFAANGGCLLSTSVLKSLGSAANSIYWERNTAPIEYDTSPGTEQLKKDLQSSGQKQEADDELIQGYAGYLLLQHAATLVPAGQPINRTTILAAMKTVSGWNADGLTAMLDFTKPGPDSNFPRYVAPIALAFPSKVVDGRLVSAKTGS
jgi:hypothetical protein